MIKLLIGICVVFIIYAIYFEYTENHHSYQFNKYEKTDNVETSFRKLKRCLNYNAKTIKWRRVLISTFLCIFLLYALYYNRIPSAKDLVIHFFFIFIVFYVMWQTYVSTVSQKVIDIGLKNIKNIQNKS